MLDAGVAPVERLPSLLVVETLRVPTNESKVLPLMLVVTLETAVPLACVKPPPSADPLGEILVANEALFRGKTLAGAVTSGAVPESFKLRVRPMERSRRYELIQLLSLAQRRHCEQRKTRHEPPPDHHVGMKPRYTTTET